MKYLANFNHPAIFWFMALSWTVLSVFVLLKPGNGTIDYEITLSSFIENFFSLSISRKDLSEAIGHIFLFSILTALWQRVLTMHFNRLNALLLTICIVGVLAIGTEIGQYFVNRGSMLIDLIANFLGISLSLFWARYKFKYK